MKTSITLSRDLVEEIDRLAGAGGSRSALIEEVLRGYLARRGRDARDARDLDHLNRAAERLNAEAADVLAWQAWPEGEAT